MRPGIPFPARRYDYAEDYDMSDTSVCPVCGSAKSLMPLSEYDCDACGFANAYVRYFASAQGNRQWLQDVEKAKKEWLKKQKPEPEISASLTAASGAIAWCSANDRKVYIAFGKDVLEEEQDAVGFSSSELNYAVLYSNGKVRVYGEENDFGQKETSGWNDIISVTAAPNCTYGVTSDGQVLTAGIPAVQGIASWIQIRKIECGSSYAAGLRDDGRVILCGTFMGVTKNTLIRNWTNMIDIKIAKDILIGLRSDGTVAFAGKKDDPRAEVKKWQNIAAVAADNAYVYGLTKEGRIVMAGNASRFLDRGRSGAKNWENIISISCNQTGIAAVNKEGDLLFAGTIAGDIEAVRDIWQEHIKKAIV